MSMTLREAAEAVIEEYRKPIKDANLVELTRAILKLEKAVKSEPPSPRPSLTPAEASVLNVMRNFLRRYGYMPTIRHTATLLGRSSATVFEQLSHMERKGYIRRDARRRRGVIILDEQ